MQPLQQAIATWLTHAEAKAANGGVTQADLQQLRQLSQTTQPRQRLLYLHTKAPSIYAAVIGMAGWATTPISTCRMCQGMSSPG